LRIGLLNNMHAGRSSRRMKQIVREIDGAADVLHAVTTSAEMVPEALGEMQRADVELLIVNGGDGTIEHVLSELLAKGRPAWLPVIAPIRGGRTNMTAADLGAARNSVRGLREVIAAARVGRLAERIVPRAVLRVTPGHGGAVRCGMCVVAGFLGRAVQLTTRHLPKGRAQETIGVGLVTATLLSRFMSGARGELFRPDKVRLAFDGAQLPDEERVITVFSTLERLVFGIRPYWGTQPGPIHATLIRGEAERLARTLPGIISGRASAFATPEHGYTSANVSRVEMRLDCEAAVDGELFPIEPDAAYTITAEERVPFARA
jgi:diacylglycerol kinase family enzyme